MILEFLIGKEVNIFNPTDTTENFTGLMGQGQVVDIKEGWITLADPGGEPDFAVNLTYVGKIVVCREEPTAVDTKDNIRYLPPGKDAS